MVLQNSKNTKTIKHYYKNKKKTLKIKKKKRLLTDKYCDRESVILKDVFSQKRFFLKKKKSRSHKTAH